MTELCPSASVLAQQLTHVELERLSFIGPEEFVQAFAKVKQISLMNNSILIAHHHMNLEVLKSNNNHFIYLFITGVTALGNLLQGHEENKEFGIIRSVVQQIELLCCNGSLQGMKMLTIYYI